MPDPNPIRIRSESALLRIFFAEISLADLCRIRIRIRIIKNFFAEISLADLVPDPNPDLVPDPELNPDLNPEPNPIRIGSRILI